MKTMLKILLGILLCFAVFSCDNDKPKQEQKGVQVRFTNTTKNDISDLVIDKIKIGNLAKGQTTKYISFEEFGFDTGMPDAHCVGTIDGEKIESYNQFYFCGTEKTTVKKGKYEFHIELVEVENKKYLGLSYIDKQKK